MIKHCELRTLLLDEQCTARIAAMTGEQLTADFGADFGRLRAYNQNNPHHHLDLLAHTLAVLDGVRDRELPEEDRLCLALAALLHDIGKPATAAQKQDRTVFYGHPAAGREIAGRFLGDCGVEASLAARVLFLVSYHDAFISFRLPFEPMKHHSRYLHTVSPETVTARVRTIRTESETEYRFRPTAADYRLLLRLCRADAAAQAEQVILGGAVTDTRENKLARLHHIALLLPAAV